MNVTSQLDVQHMRSKGSIRGILSQGATAWVAITRCVRSVTPPQGEKSYRVSPIPMKRCRKVKLPCFGDAHGPPSQGSA